MTTRAWWIGLLSVCVSLSSVACEKSGGTCELTYEERSRDGSIPAGLAAWLPDWKKADCDPVSLRSVTLGLKTSGYDFTGGATCPELGYQDCSGGTAVVFYKTCPPQGAMAAAPEPARAGRTLDRPKPAPGKSARVSLDAPLAVPGDAPFRGNGEGKLVIHLFTDFQDPYTKRLLPTLEQLVAERDELKVVFRHHPLPFHRDAPLAHQATIEAYVQQGNDGFWALHDLLFANQRKLGRADLLAHGEKVGLDRAALEKALDAGTHRARLQEDMAVAAEAGVKAAPVMVVETKILRGALPKASIETVLDEVAAGL